MAGTSGFFVPPTVGRSGCSQNRVTAIGVMPHASSVSVAEGTRLTTRRLRNVFTPTIGIAPSCCHDATRYDELWTTHLPEGIMQPLPCATGGTGCST